MKRTNKPSIYAAYDGCYAVVKRKKSKKSKKVKKNQKKVLTYITSGDIIIKSPRATHKTNDLQASRHAALSIMNTDN